jgi:hypothetical protein
LAVDLDCALNKVLDLCEFQRLFDAETCLETCAATVSALFLDLGKAITCFADGLFAYPAGCEFGPALTLREGCRWWEVGVPVIEFPINVSPVVFARAETPRYLEIQIFVIFFCFYRCCCFDRET